MSFFLIQGHSGSSPETFRNALGTNQGTNEDDSQSDLHPEARVYQSQTKENFGPDDGYDTVWSLQLPLIAIIKKTTPIN